MAIAAAVLRPGCRERGVGRAWRSRNCDGSDGLNETVYTALQIAEGPVFRLAFALLVLGALRYLFIHGADAVAAYLTTADTATFWRRLRLRVLWLTFPGIVLRQECGGGSTALFVYHLSLCCLSMVFRLTALLVPAFMVEHVYLWERNLGIAWPTLPLRLADILSIIAIVTGLTLFLGRLYSPVLRKIEPPWSFLKPLLIVLAFGTGMLAMHPTWNPFDYHVVLLIHVLSAAVVFMLIPFGRLLACMHVRLIDVVPDAAWDAPDEAATAHRAPAIEST